MAPKPETEQDEPPKDELQEQIDSVAAETAEALQQEQQVADEDLDADALEALIARREADAEVAGAPPAGEGEEQPPAEQEAAPEEPEPVQPPPDTRTVPLAALQHERQKARALELEIARLNGIAEGQHRAGRPAAQEAPPEPTPEQKRAAVEAEWDTEIEALAKRYDDGEIGLAEHGKTLRRLNARYQGQVEEIVRQPVTQPSQPDPEALERDINDDSGVRRASTKLADDNPWLRQSTPGLRKALEADLAAVQPRGIEWARHIAEQAGQNYDRLGVRGQTVFLRIGMVAAAKEAGLDQQYSRTIDAPSQSPPQQPAQPQKGRHPNPGAPTTDQRRAKAGLARTHPPDLTQAGSPAGSGQAVTEADIEGMTDEEIEALPKSVKDKLLGLA